MAKVNTQKRIQKRRTEQELRSALTSLVEGKAERSTPAQDYDADVVLTDCIEELLEHRQLIEEIKATVFQWQVKFQRK